MQPPNRATGFLFKEVTSSTGSPPRVRFSFLPGVINHTGSNCFLNAWLICMGHLCHLCNLLFKDKALCDEQDSLLFTFKKTVCTLLTTSETAISVTCLYDEIYSSNLCPSWNRNTQQDCAELHVNFQRALNKNYPGTLASLQLREKKICVVCHRENIPHCPIVAHNNLLLVGYRRYGILAPRSSLDAASAESGGSDLVFVLDSKLILDSLVDDAECRCQLDDCPSNAVLPYRSTLKREFGIVTTPNELVIHVARFVNEFNALRKEKTAFLISEQLSIKAESSIPGRHGK